MAAVVETVQKLGGHEDFLLSHILCRLAPRAVVLRLETVAVGPGVEDHALLRVKLLEDRLQFVVEAALVAVAPEDDAGMVDVAGDHLLDELRAGDGLVCPVPARQLALHVETQRVAGIEELRVGGVVAEAHGVHVHRLDELHVLDVLCLRQCAATLRAEGVAVHTLHDDLLPVDEDTVAQVAFKAVAVLDGAEAEALSLRVEGLALRVFKGEYGGVEIGLLGVP